MNKEKDLNNAEAKKVPLERVIIQRYAMRGHASYTAMEKNERGDYVKYEDHKKALSIIKQWVDMGLPECAKMLADLFKDDLAV